MDATNSNSSSTVCGCFEEFASQYGCKYETPTTYRNTITPKTNSVSRIAIVRAPLEGVGSFVEREELKVNK